MAAVDLHDGQNEDLQKKHEDDGHSRDSGIASCESSPEKATVVQERRSPTTESFDQIETLDDLLSPSSFRSVVSPDKENLERPTDFSSLHRAQKFESQLTNLASSKTFIRRRSRKLSSTPLTSRLAPRRPVLDPVAFNLDDSAEDLPTSPSRQRPKEPAQEKKSNSTTGFVQTRFPVRRTVSEFAGSLNYDRKRNMESSESYGERKRCKALVVNDANTSLLSLDDNVFFDDDISPNTSFFSTAQSTSTSSSRSVIHRAMSTSVLEMKESLHSPHLPRPLEVAYSLQVVEKPQKDSQAFKSISASTLANLIRSHGVEKFDEMFTVVDCRYPYEYDGGHIMTAINIHEQVMGDLEKLFFPDDVEASIRKRIPIFYCEYSQKRGPAMAHKLRALDRQRNELRYPHVDYPEIYLLDYGYRRFYQTDDNKSLCYPSNYVEMTDNGHTDKLRMFSKSRTFSKSMTLTRLAVGGMRQMSAIRHMSLVQLKTEVLGGETPKRSSFERTSSLVVMESTSSSVVLTATRAVTSESTLEPATPAVGKLNFDTDDSSTSQSDSDDDSSATLADFPSPLL